MVHKLVGMKELPGRAAWLASGGRVGGGTGGARLHVVRGLSCCAWMG